MPSHQPLVVQRTIRVASVSGSLHAAGERRRAEAARTTHVMVICILRETWPLVNDPIERDVRTALSMLSRALSDSEPRCSRRVVLENLPPIPTPFSIAIDKTGAVQKLIDITEDRRYFSRSILGRRSEDRLAEIGMAFARLNPNLIPSRN